MIRSFPARPTSIVPPTSSRSRPETSPAGSARSTPRSPRPSGAADEAEQAAAGSGRLVLALVGVHQRRGPRPGRRRQSGLGGAARAPRRGRPARPRRLQLDRAAALSSSPPGSDNGELRQQRDGPNPGAPRPRQAAGPCVFLCPRGHLPTRCAFLPLPLDILSPCGSGRQAVRSGRPGRRGARGGHLRPSGTASLVRIVWPRAGSQSTSRL